MEIPKEISKFCKKCTSHKKHKLKVFKTGKTRTLGEHTRKHHINHIAGYGGVARHIRPKKKQAKRPTFLALCKECGSKSYFSVSSRMKKQATLV